MAFNFIEIIEGLFAMSKQVATTFLSYFWDLSSEDCIKRQEAAMSVVNHLQDPQNLANDLAYTLKRLFRGLGSSNEAARHGFATCLIEVIPLSKMDGPSLLAMLEVHTKITGSMKGSEERNFIFGKFFGYISIIRSLPMDSEGIVESLLTLLLDLYHKKSWIQEAVLEAIFSLIHKLIESDVSKETIMKYLKQIEKSFHVDSDSSPSELLLCLHFQILSRKVPHVSKVISTHLSVDNLPVALATNLSNFKSVLLQSTTGYPKIHRLWELILGEVFGLDEERILPSSRFVLTSSMNLYIPVIGDDDKLMT